MKYLTVVVPAYNEVAELPATLDGLHRALRTAAGDDWEIVVVDNASADGTASAARERGARVVSEPHRQISRARNTGARHAAADYLLFVDADTWPDARLLSRMLARLDAGVCGGGALVSMNGLDRPLYRRGLRLWNALSMRLSLAAGCFLFARRDAFEAVGGFDQRYYAGDEVLLSRKLGRWGRKRGRAFEIIDDPPVRSSPRKAQWFSPAQHLATMAMVLLCPPVMRSRRLMWFWYRRPGSERSGAR